MSLRVSQIVLQVVLLDEYDAPRAADPITFSGDADGTAEVKLKAWLADLPDHLAKADGDA